MIDLKSRLTAEIDKTKRNMAEWSSYPVAHEREGVKLRTLQLVAAWVENETTTDIKREEQV